MLTSALRTRRGGLCFQRTFQLMSDDFKVQESFLFSLLFPSLRLSFRFLPHASYHALRGRAGCHGLILRSPP